MSAVSKAILEAAKKDQSLSTEAKIKKCIALGLPREEVEAALRPNPLSDLMDMLRKATGK